MSMSAAMSAALSGLRATQAGLDVVADNVSNAGSADYTRKRLPTRQLVVADKTNGVQTGEVLRSLDLLLQRQMRAEAAGSAYTSTKVTYHDRIDQLFGSPGEAGALDTVINDFTKSLQNLVTSPDSYTARTEVLNNAQLLSQHLNGMSDDVQLMRSEAESAIATAVDRANEALSNIARLNDQIVSQGADGVAPAALLDERDRYVSQLASLMDIRVVSREQNKIAIFTNSGAMLFDRDPAILSFDGRGAVDANSLYSRDSTQRGVGTIRLTAPNGFQVDMIGEKLIRSGEIGALVELRDSVLVDAQTQLDTLAASISTALSNRPVNGVASSSGGATGFDLDLTGMQNGNEIRIGYRSGGQDRQAILVQVDPSTTLPLPQPYGGANGVEVIGFSGGVAGAQAALQAKLGAGFTVSTSGNVVTVLDDGAAATTDVLSLSTSSTNLSPNGPGNELPLFVDAGNGTKYTGAYGDPPQIRGFAARIGVNTTVINDRSLLVQPTSTTANGNPARPQFLLDALTKAQRVFSPETGIGGTRNPFNGTVTAFAREIVETQGRDSTTARNLDEGQQVVMKSLEDRFQQTSGVNIDTEMANLVQLQNAYAANARVMTTVKDMLDLLLRM
ncbi:MAG: flagellar hook-associated protein FlgK [Labrys sp. (in: a-proteobacteria)]